MCFESVGGSVGWAEFAFETCNYTYRNNLRVLLKSDSCLLQSAEKHGDGGEVSVKRHKPPQTKKKMTDAEIHSALRKCLS